MKEILIKIKNNRLILLLVVFLLFCIVIGLGVSYGAYVRRSYIKAVIATNETEKLFGSNLLYGIKTQPVDPESDSWLSIYPYSTSLKEGETSIVVPIKIYNYLAEDHDRINQLDVSYIISFRITGNPTIDGGKLKGYSVNGRALDNQNVVYYLADNTLTTDRESAKNQTLPGRLPNMNEYDIIIPSTDLGKVSIAVKAICVANELGNFGTDLLYLAARVVPSLPSTVQTATVSGEFLYNSGEKPEDYAAYNYNITLTGAPTVVVLEWNNSLLEIDPFFEEKYGVEPIDGKVIFNMDPGITKVQFYRKGETTGKTWENLEVTVSSH